jgi:AcrR family transcriptional regulator
LESALLELITERDLTRISVSDLTKRAGVNRSTFYEHYADVHDLAAAACTALFDELIATGPASVRRPPPDGGPRSNPLPGFFAHVAQHADLYRALLGDDGSARVINHLLHRMASAARARRRPTDAAPEAASHDPSHAFIAGAVLGTVIDWLRHGCPGSPEGIGAAVWSHILAAAPPELPPPAPASAPTPGPGPGRCLRGGGPGSKP